MDRLDTHRETTSQLNMPPDQLHSYFERVIPSACDMVGNYTVRSSHDDVTDLCRRTITWTCASYIRSTSFSPIWSIQSKFYVSSTSICQQCRCRSANWPAWANNNSTSATCYSDYRSLFSRWSRIGVGTSCKSVENAIAFMRGQIGRTYSCRSSWDTAVHDLACDC